MMELMMLRPLFPSNNDLDQMYRVFQVVGAPHPSRWPVRDVTTIVAIIVLITIFMVIIILYYAYCDFNRVLSYCQIMRK